MLIYIFLIQECQMYKLLAVLYISRDLVSKDASQELTGRSQFLSIDHMLKEKKNSVNLFHNLQTDASNSKSNSSRILTIGRLSRGNKFLFPTGKQFKSAKYMYHC